VQGYPSVRLYMPHEDHEEIYDGEHTPEALEAWVRSVRQSPVERLGGGNFEERVRGA
jgi:hypothetical protein